MSENVILNRIAKLREGLKNKNIDAALICKKENCTYLSGFNGGDSFLVISQEQALLVTDFRYVEQAEEQAPLYKVVQFERDLLAKLSEILKSLDVKNLGFEEGYVTYKMYFDFKDKLEVSQLVPLEGVVESLRLVKDQDEINVIKKAVEIADNAFSHIIKYIKPGVTELEIAAELEYFMKKQGGKGPSFEIIVASGERASMPHGTASEKKIAQGDVITLDYGVIYRDYCSDMTRTVFLGQPNEELKNIYNIVLDAQIKALNGAIAGILGKEIDLIARDIISSGGFEKNFGHGLGHGVGLEIHEEPRLSPAGNKIMEDGMVVTVEPGIYVAGLGGVRIEDMIVINRDKPIILTKSSKELLII